MKLNCLTIFFQISVCLMCPLKYNVHPKCARQFHSFPISKVTSLNRTSLWCPYLRGAPTWRQLSTSNICLRVHLRISAVKIQSTQDSSHWYPKISDICLNKPYSRYWTGTVLQWRLMRANIIKRDWSFASVKSPQFEASSRPLPWMQIWSTAHG